MAEFERCHLSQGEGRGGKEDTVFGGCWNTIVWDGFETANTDGVLNAPVTALRERSQMTILSTKLDPFDKIEDDVSIFVLFHMFKLDHLQEGQECILLF